MRLKRKHPAWWQLYVGLPLLSSLFVFEINLHLNQTEDIVLQLLILALIFIFMRAWLRANNGALMEMDEGAPERQEPYGVRVYEIPPAASVAPGRVTTVRRAFIDIAREETRSVPDTALEVDAEQPDSLFQSPVSRPQREDALPLEHFRSPVQKE